MAAEYGVTSNGFIRKEMETIREELFNSFDEEFGVAVSRRADSTIGLLVGIMSYGLSDLWELAEAVYNAMYPSSAEGVGLDGAVSFAGVKRIAGEKTIVNAVLYGKNGTVIPSTAQIRSSVNQGLTFTIMAADVISIDNSVLVELNIGQVNAGERYYIILAGETISYIARENDTAVLILNGLASQINSGYQHEINNSKLVIKALDITKTFSFLASNNIIVGQIASPAKFQCDSYGDIDPGIGKVTEIVTQIIGWEAVNNPIAAVIGRNDETTTELRQRYDTSVYILGCTMLESIRANLLENVPGVTAAIVFENHTDNIDSDGRPPHSIECVVQGGEKEDIADMIWQQKAAGIDTHGSVEVEILDSQGAVQIMKFNRPTQIKVWLKVKVGRNLEEELPGDTLYEVRNIILSEGKLITIGQDVVLQKFMGPIYKGTIGIGYLIIEAAVGEMKPKSEEYTPNNILISVREVAVFSEDRIEVELIE